MSIFLEDKAIKVGGVVLPGVLKKCEVTAEASIDEIEVEGSAVRPKQAVGYEDVKIKVELIVDATANETIDGKLAKINKVFHPPGQLVPQPLVLVCKEASAAGVGKVLFKNLTYTFTNKSNEYAVTLEFWEYHPVAVTATPAKVQGAGTGTNAAPSLSGDFQSYLDELRGLSPKTAQTPARDDRQPVYGGSYADRLQYGD